MIWVRISGIGMVFFLNSCPKFWCPYCVWRCKELYILVGLVRNIEVFDLGLEFWNWFVFGYWSFMQICSKFWHSTMIVKLQRTSMVLFWLVYRGWWRFLTWNRNLDFDSDMVTSLWYTYVKILAVWNCFEDAKNIHVLEVVTGDVDGARGS